jgi:hypothetical protein
VRGASLVNDAPEPTADLLLGRRALDGVPDVELLGDLAWDPQEQSWVLPLRLLADTQGSPIPEVTEWYVLIDPAYPFGDIDFLPSKRGGLDTTYPHQRLNREGPPSRPWRDGRLCLQTGLAALGLRAQPEEPFEPGRRLAWHVQRAREWIEDASREQLLAPGHAFELPDLPIADVSRVAFQEGTDSFSKWSAIDDELGWVDLIPLPDNPRVHAIKEFRSLEGRRLLASKWGDLLHRVPRMKSTRALWLRSARMPFLLPYAAPTNWAELAEAARHAGWNLPGRIEAVVPQLRDGTQRLCLIGFPIPEKVGGIDVRMHWWALRLPIFAHGDVGARGYRRNERGYWRHDRTRLFERRLPIEWIQTDNWASGELRSRGALPPAVRNPRMLLIGAGALGSSMAELLVRGGLSSLVIMDTDRLEAGNLTRHTLGFPAVCSFKAKALAEHLRSVSPDLEVHSLCESPDTTDATSQQLVKQCSIIMDCTASNDVIAMLGKLKWDSPRLFFSASFGFKAKRLFCFCATGHSFPTEAFWELAGGWIRREHAELRSQSLPREGIGCWHPVFPARADDVFLAASVAVKSLEQAAAASPAARFEVYAREEEEADFRGVKRVERIEKTAQS